MSGSYNRVILLGNLCRDPELKTLPSGTQVCEFSLAVNERITRGDQYETHANFFDCTAFGKSAESIAKYFSKGRPILIEGKLRYRSWQAQDGAKRSKVEVVVDQWAFVDSKQGGAQQQAAPPMEIPEDDIPF